MDAGAKLHAQAQEEVAIFETNQMADNAAADARREAEKQAELDRLAGAGGSWDKGNKKIKTGAGIAGRSADEEDQHRAAIAIQSAQRQKHARSVAQGKKVQKEKKKAQQQAEAEAKLRLNQGAASEAYGEEHEEAAIKIQNAERSKLARQKVKKKRKEKGDIGGVGGLGL